MLRAAGGVLPFGALPQVARAGFVHSVKKAGFPGLKAPHGLTLEYLRGAVSLETYLWAAQKGCSGLLGCFCCLPSQRALLRKLD